MRKLTTPEFINHAKKVHGDTYDYELVEYINDKTNIVIVCKKHGKFKQTPNNHKTGKGCPICSINSINNKNTKTTEQFIQKAKQVHGDTYDYSKVEYFKSISRVKIICFEHGEFKQEAASHLMGAGCKKCANKLLAENPNGWSYTSWEKAAKNSKNFDSFKIYKIRCWNGEEGFYKIGRTYLTVNKRLRKLPYNYEVLGVEYFDNAKECCEREQELLLQNRGKYTPKIKFNGMHECFITLNRYK